MTFLYLIPTRAFRANNQWNHLLTLFEYCHKFLPDLGDESCIVTEMIIDQPGLKERAMNLIDRMPGDLALRLSAEVKQYKTRLIVRIYKPALEATARSSCTASRQADPFHGCI